MSTTNNQIIVKGQIADSSGHTDFAGTLDEAMTIIMQQVTQAGKWVYLNGSPYMFQNYDLTEQEEVRQKLANADEPSFMLTAKLQGGATTCVRTKVTKSPISKVLSSSNRAQMTIGMKGRGASTKIDVTVSDYNGSKARLAKHREEILSAVFKLLGDK